MWGGGNRARRFLFALLTAVSTLATVKQDVGSGFMFVSLWLLSATVTALSCVHTPTAGGGGALQTTPTEVKRRLSDKLVLLSGWVFYKRYDLQTELQPISVPSSSLDLCVLQHHLHSSPSFLLCFLYSSSSSLKWRGEQLVIEDPCLSSGPQDLRRLFSRLACASWYF